ncbi:MAG: helix-turn-helix transcriptional regulator [Prevotella sp.]|jgi:transcriptional regulator with XRE-family HTH domain|nr:helix-turn-helix transcriptional regulator [Prevotella sp.]
MKLRIQEIAKSKGLTLKDLAEKLGISNVGLSQQINGNPTIETLKKISDTLDVDFVELFESDSKEDTVNCPYCGNKIKLTKEK